jgi:hypothetical protein
MMSSCCGQYLGGIVDLPLWIADGLLMPPDELLMAGFLMLGSWCWACDAVILMLSS